MRTACRENLRAVRQLSRAAGGLLCAANGRNHIRAGRHGDHLQDLPCPCPWAVCARVRGKLRLEGGSGSASEGTAKRLVERLNELYLASEGGPERRLAAGSV